MRLIATVVGLKAIERKLKKLTPTETKKVVRKSARPAAKIWAAEAKRRAPVGKTGALRKSIKVRAIKRSRVRVGVRVASWAGDAFYGGMVEYGFNHKRAGRKIRGKHFLRKSFRAKKRAVRTEYLKHLRKEFHALVK